MYCRRLLTIVLVTLASVASGQTENFSSLSMFNYMYYNPGYAGDGNEIEARALVRSQWMGFEGAPQTQTFSIDAPFKLFGIRNGAGLTIINDEIGNFQNIGLNFSYAYRRQMLQGEVGFGAGLSMYRLFARCRLYQDLVQAASRRGEHHRYLYQTQGFLKC